MDSLEWAKRHQKEIASRLISDAELEPSTHPIAIFMAGLPGAGKTELSQGLIKEASPKPIRIDMDELATMIEGYTPEKADEFRAGATRLLNVIFDKVIKSRLDFVLDGTFGSPVALRNIERVLKRGYEVQVAFACQDPKLAWEFTKAREMVEHRSITKDGFLEAYYKTFNNLHLLAKRNYPDVLLNIFVKKQDNSVGSTFIGVSDDAIDDIAGFIYNKDNLRKYIEGTS